MQSGRFHSHLNSQYLSLIRIIPENVSKDFKNSAHTKKCLLLKQLNVSSGHVLIIYLIKTFRNPTQLKSSQVQNNRLEINKQRDNGTRDTNLFKISCP